PEAVIVPKDPKDPDPQVPTDPQDPSKPLDPQDPSLGTKGAVAVEGEDLVFTVTVTDSVNPQTYDFVINNGTAEAGKDFTTNNVSFTNGVTYDPATGKITVPAGVTSFEVTVKTIDDKIIEDTESLSVTVGNSTAVGYIIDNDYKLTTDDSFSTKEDTSYIININDFGTPLTIITKVKIVEIPTNGQLLLNGTVVKAGQEINRVDIDNGKLVFKPNTNTDEDGNFEFLVYDGTQWATVEAKTEIIVTAVADTPTTSIDAVKLSSGEYTVKIDAELTDTDGSEILTVKISNVPNGAELTSTKYEVTKNTDGSWNVKVPVGVTSISDTLVMNNVPKGTDWVNLKITATATETNDNIDGKNFKTAESSDATVYGVGENNQVCMESFKYNLVITLDNSGSMNGTPMTLAKAAMVNLVNKYSNLGEVKVLLNVFNSYGEIKGIWVNPSEAINLINQITAGGGTNYDDAILKNINVLSKNPAPLDGKTISYFVSDGNPTYKMVKNSNGEWVISGNGSATESVTKIISDQWKNLDIDKSYAIGIGTNELNTHLKNIANDVTIISNANQLSDALEGTVQELIYEGTVSDNIFGGDPKVKIDSIIVDGKTYTKDTFPANGVITGDNKIKLTFDFNTGDYKYYAKSSKFSVENVGFKVNVSDNNGDMTSLDVGLKVSVITEIYTPTANIDVVNTSTINYQNASITSKGYTIGAYDLNGAKGEMSIVSSSNISGFGVKGASSGDSNEIGYLNGKSEEIRVKFDNKVTDVNVKFSWLASSETAKISFYKNGILVGTAIQKGLTDTIDGPFSLKPSNGSLFDEIRFSANGANDDYLVNSIEYNEVVVDNNGTIAGEVYNVNFGAALKDNSGVLSVKISNVPEGASFDLPNMKNLGNGVWEVEIPAGSKAIDYSNVKMIVPAGTNYVDLKITATASSEAPCSLNKSKEAVESDATLYALSESEQAKMNTFKYNLILTIDNSGSMSGNPITLAKAAMVNLVNKYTQLGEVKVFLTTFSDYGEIKGAWVDAKTAINLINSISTKNMTNYDDALLKIINNIKPVPYNEGKTVSYFVSDGQPNYGMKQDAKGNWILNTNANSVNSTLSKQFKELAIDKSYAIGIGTNALNTHLNAVSNDVTIISNAEQLSKTLEDTVQELLVEGNFLDNVIGGDEKITADIITFEGKQYTKDTFPKDGIISGTNNIKLTVDFDTGDYKYYAKSSKFTEEIKVFNVEASDNNGDKVKYDIEAEVKVVTGKAENIQKLTGEDIDLSKVITKTTDIIDMENGKTTDKLKVDFKDILDLNDKELVIKGDKGDKVQLNLNEWDVKATSNGYKEYVGKGTNSTVKLLIDDEIDITNI
ncbi:VWA domain-containing protein, partial [Aliarcobacter cibarius]